MQAEGCHAAAIEFEKRAATLVEQIKVETALTSTEKALVDKFSRISELTETIENYKSDLSNQQKEIETLVSGGTGGAKPNSKRGLANAAKLSREAGILEKSMAAAEAEAQKLRKELENLDQDWEARKKERAETKKAADKANSEPPRKSATVTPLRPLNNKKSEEADSDKSDAPKKAEPKTVAAKMMAATKAAAGKRAKSGETSKKKRAKMPDAKEADDGQVEVPEAAVANEAVNGTNGAKNSSGGPKVQKVLSLAQRIRVLQTKLPTDGHLS